MAGIQDYLNQIKNAIYGKDVRQAIHDGIEQCYKDGKAGAVDLEARQRISSLATLVDGSTTGDAELIDARTIGTKTYPTLHDAIDTEVTNLKSDLASYGGINLLTKPQDSGSTTSKGITYSVTNGKYRFSGTASDNFTLNVLVSAASYPSWVERGKSYYLNLDKKGSNIENLKIEIGLLRADSSFIWLVRTNESMMFTIPNSTEFVGIHIRFRVDSGKAVDCNTVLSILNYKTNNVLTEEVNQLVSDVLSYGGMSLLERPDDVYSASYDGITYSVTDGEYKFSGTATNTFVRTVFVSATSFPSWVERGKSYYLNFDKKGNNTENLKIEIGLLRADSSFIWLVRTTESTMFTIPTSNEFVGIHIRFKIESGDTVDCSTMLSVLNYKTNEVIAKEVEQLQNGIDSVPVKIIKEGNWYYVRTSFDKQNDAVMSFAMPYEGLNYTFNFQDVRLIPSSTAINDTTSEYRTASIYKDCSDDIPAMQINGYYTGSNHGNPNYIECVVDNELTNSDIGTVWTDGTYDYTLVQVFPTYLVFGSLDENDNLVVRTPSTLRTSGKQLTISSSSSIQLRRSAINKSWKIEDNLGNVISSSGGGTNVIVTEEYDINDQGKGLLWLQGRVGYNTNDSYFDDRNPYHLGHIKNIFSFNRGGSITAYGEFTAKKALLDNRIYGAISYNFSNGGTGYSDLAYVPQSNRYQTVVPSGGYNIRKDGDVAPYRFYQMSDNNRAHFLHLINNLGDCDPAIRAELDVVGYFSAPANKLYLSVIENTQMSAGDTLAWGYGRGIMKWSNAQTVLSHFDIDDGWIVSMDWHNGHNGYVDLPDYMSGHTFEVIDKTESVSVHGSYISSKGLKIDCNGYGYCVLKVR